MPGLTLMEMFQVDAFTRHVFSGNPAAVCPLDAWLSDVVLQQIASENNLSETAFFVGRDGVYDLRWFTPTQEVDLCGHATLASAFVLWNCLKNESAELRFQTRSGTLTVSREDGRMVMNFPVLAPRPVPLPDEVVEGLMLRPAEGGIIREGTRSGNYLAVYGSEADVRSLTPDFNRLGRLDRMGVIVTAPGEDADFVSRYFAPAFGIPEDPVTGSIHCSLVPFWAARLNRTELSARQVSKRGGELFCRLEGDRVLIAGDAVLYLRGSLSLA